MNQGMHQKKFRFNIQGLPQSADQPKLEITVLANTQDMLRHCHVAIKYTPRSLTVWTGVIRLPKSTRPGIRGTLLPSL